jgi:hypothetical protein
MTVLTRETPFLPPQCEASDLRCEDSQIQNLWQAVIRQAALDLRGPVGHRSKIERSDAEIRRVETDKWVRGKCCNGDDHFAEVCDLAGVDATPVREDILQKLPVSEQFPSAKPEEIQGSTVEPKYCERCGKSFLRPQEGKQAMCAACAAQESGRTSTMPLASAVSLGIRYLESDPDTEPEPTKPYVPGDLLRMTCLAANVPLNQAEAQRRWPCLGEEVDSPCDCKNLIISNALLVLQHLYETHVQARQDWTAKELIDWIREHAHRALALEQSEQPQNTEEPNAGLIQEFTDTPCGSYEPNAVEAADTQAACAN